MVWLTQFWSKPKSWFYSEVWTHNLSKHLFCYEKAVNENLNTIKCCSKKLGWQSYQWWLSESIHSGKILKGMYPVPSQVWLSFDDYDFMPNNRISAGLNSASAGCVLAPGSKVWILHQVISINDHGFKYKVRAWELRVGIGQKLDCLVEPEDIPVIQ